MSTANANNNANDLAIVLSGDDLAAKAVNKLYEKLAGVRTKAVKGKGAWYWAHLEPILVRNPENNLPKAVKLKCNRCDSYFSASNPSRTASEHLKRGTCPNFNTTVVSPISQLPPLASPSSQNNRKRSSDHPSSSSYQFTIFDSPRPVNDVGYPPQVTVAQSSSSPTQLVLSGGKEDLGALAMLEDSVKKLKSSKTSPGPALSRDQVDSAFNLLSEWFYESCGSVSISSLENPSFKAFLSQVGMPPISRREVSGSRLDSRFEQVRMEVDAKIRDAVFFQVGSDGWKGKNCRCGEESVVNFLVNLPNGSSVFQKVATIAGSVPSQYAEEVLWETTRGISGNAVQRCAGIVADKYKAKALRNLEAQHHWMVNLSCQHQGISSLLKDFIRELPVFQTVINNCLKIASFFNSKPQIRSSFHKFRLQEPELSGLMRAPCPKIDFSKNSSLVVVMIEDILRYARVLHWVVLDESFKALCMEDLAARDIAETVQDVGFWNKLEAVHALVKLIEAKADEVEAERPLVGQCLPLWEELRTKLKEWCAKYSIVPGPVEKILERRFNKNYHPAWSAAFVLDPLYLMKDASGKYLPPFKCLTHEQVKDVDKLITRLVSREEAHIALMELMKWRSEGLDPLYAQAVQVKQRDPVTGKLKIANPQSSRIVWETCLKDFRALGKVAVRLLFLHATSCGFKHKWSIMRWICEQGHPKVCLDRAQKMIFIAAHAKLERRDFSSIEEKDADLFGRANSSDDMLNDVFADTNSV